MLSNFGKSWDHVGIIFNQVGAIVIHFCAVLDRLRPTLGLLQPMSLLGLVLAFGLFAAQLHHAQAVQHEQTWLDFIQTIWQDFHLTLYNIVLGMRAAVRA